MSWGGRHAFFCCKEVCGFLMTYDYFYGEESEQFTFYRIPKALFNDDQFIEMSTDAKLLYGILLDRMSLSKMNGWRDRENRVFIIFTIEEA